MRTKNSSYQRRKVTTFFQNLTSLKTYRVNFIQSCIYQSTFKTPQFKLNHIIEKQEIQNIRAREKSAKATFAARILYILSERGESAREIPCTLRCELRQYALCVSACMRIFYAVKNYCCQKSGQRLKQCQVQLSNNRSNRIKVHFVTSNGIGLFIYRIIVLQRPHCEYIYVIYFVLYFM